MVSGTPVLLSGYLQQGRQPTHGTKGTHPRLTLPHAGAAQPSVLVEQPLVVHRLAAGDLHRRGECSCEAHQNKGLGWRGWVGTHGKHRLLWAKHRLLTTWHTRRAHQAHILEKRPLTFAMPSAIFSEMSRSRSRVSLLFLKPWASRDSRRRSRSRSLAQSGVGARGQQG